MEFIPCSPATAATETPGLRQVAKSVALNSGEYLRWVRRFEYLGFSEVLSIVSTIKFVDKILQDTDANLNMTLLDAYHAMTIDSDPLRSWTLISLCSMGAVGVGAGNCKGTNPPVCAMSVAGEMLTGG